MTLTQKVQVQKMVERAFLTMNWNSPVSDTLLDAQYRATAFELFRIPASPDGLELEIMRLNISTRRNAIASLLLMQNDDVRTLLTEVMSCI